jgi:hypothetical protein
MRGFKLYNNISLHKNRKFHTLAKEFFRTCLRLNARKYYSFENIGFGMWKTSTFGDILRLCGKLPRCKFRVPFIRPSLRAYVIDSFAALLKKGHRIKYV